MEAEICDLDELTGSGRPASDSSLLSLSFFQVSLSLSLFLVSLRLRLGHEALF